MGSRGIISRFLQSLGIERTDDEMAREQYRQLGQQIPLLYSVVLVNSLFLATATLRYVSFFEAAAFPAIAGVALVARGYLWQKRSRQYQGTEPIVTVRRALRGNVIAANVMAVVLGGWAISVMNVLPAQHAAYVPLFAILSMVTCTYCLTCRSRPIQSLFPDRA
jgi:predicted signal transduction protein with EAL and GGDEF domain